MDAELTKKIYEKVPVLIDEAMGEEENPWGIKFMSMFHMANDSHMFLDGPGVNRLPLYEAKLIHHYDHRWATYGAYGNSRDVTLAEKEDPSFQITPRYWVERSEVQARLKAQGWDRQWLMGGETLQGPLMNGHSFRAQCQLKELGIRRQFSLRKETDHCYQLSRHLLAR